MAQTKHYLAGKKIVIAGSGIAALTFVCGLKKQWDASNEFPEIVIYERDTEEAVLLREEYSISINGTDQDGGLIALRELGLLEQAIEQRLPGSDNATNFSIWDKNFSPLVSMDPKAFGDLPTPQLRIVRRDLRKVLAEAGDCASNIHWGVSCTSAEQLGDGTIRVATQQQDGSASSIECDVLIVADGAQSQMRAALRPKDTLEYQGAIQMGGIARFPNGVPKPYDETVGLCISGEGVSCFLSPAELNSVVWVVSRNEKQPRPPLDKASPAKVQDMLDECKKIGHMLKGPFMELVEATDHSTAAVLSAHDKKPFAHDKATPGVIFIGDSNHAVSAFAGNGANVALKDGWDLSSQLCQASSLAAAVSAYDAVALPRANKNLKASHQRIGMAHTSGFKFTLLRGAMAAGKWFIGT